jgi:hypothetical protein
MKFRKKPVVIEAHEMTEDQFEDQETWPQWLKDAWKKPSEEEGAFFQTEGGGMYMLRTLEGMHQVTVGDFIIQGVEGELYPCKPGIFHHTYDLVTY